MRLLFLLALATSHLALATPANAQVAPLPTDTFTYHPQAALRNLSGTLLGSGRLLLLEARHPKATDSTYLGQLWLDQHLRPTRRRSVGLRGHNLRPEQVLALRGQQVLVQLGSRDSLRLLTLDTAGRVRHQVREPLPRGNYDLLLPELPDTPGVVTLLRGKGATPSVLTYRNPDLRLRWQQRLDADYWRYSGLQRLRVVADSTHLWLLLTTYPRARHPITRAVCFSLLSGTELGRVQLGPTAAPGQRVVTAQYLNPDHSLWVVGHAYRGRAVNTHHSGDLFARRLSPAGRVLDSIQLAARHLPRELGARGRRVAWQAVVPDSAGGLRLVGETYTTTPAMASYLRGMVSLFLLSFDVLRPKDLITLRLAPGGQAQAARRIALPLDRGSYVWPSYASPLAMELLASEGHGFRTRGLAAGSQTLVLRSPQQVQAVGLRGPDAPHLLRAAPAGGNLEVLYTGPDYVLLAEARSLRNGIRLVRVALPTAR